MISIIITFFDLKLGPINYISLPKNILNDKTTEKISSFINLDFGNYGFEISLPKLNLKTFNLYLEIPSKWSRGNSDMIMITVAVDKDHKGELIYDFLNNLQFELLEIPELYKSFYRFNIEHNNNPQIEEKFVIFENILIKGLDKLKNILEKGSTNQELIQNIDQNENCVKVLSENILKLSENIAKKNDFKIINFDFQKIKDGKEGKIKISIKIKGKGFLTSSLKKITKKNILSGVFNYLISNGISRENFKINVDY